MLRSSSLIDFLINVTQINDEYNGVDNGSDYSGNSNKKYLYDFYQCSILRFKKIATPLTLMLKTSWSTDLSTSKAQIRIEFDRINACDNGSQLKSCQKVCEKSQKP